MFYWKNDLDGEVTSLFIVEKVEGGFAEGLYVTRCGERFEVQREYHDLDRLEERWESLAKYNKTRGIIERE